MTVIRKGPTFDPVVEELKNRLIEELRSDAPSREPYIIIEEKGPGRPVYIYVIWAKWGELSFEERASIILSAYEEVEGVEQVLEVGMALGLRPDEAPRFGIEPKEYMEVSA